MSTSKQLRSTDQGWSAISQTLHWLIAVLVIGLGIVGLIMTELPTSPTKIKIYALHKSVGITVLALMVLRLIWRLFDRRPAYPSGMPVWQTSLATLTHGLLYLLLFVMPLSGWLYNSASNFALRYFGWFSLPALSAPDPQLKALALEVHQWGFYLLASLLLVHVAAALKHHWMERDDTLNRMLPWRTSKERPRP
ncbi:cytochrome b [Pseudomarimonas arenosa]|uniref:Cytochrome b n=1 Tax=Pseudomarimonas arenosa TaxID=2774145 RepID=A0AAW3ZG53_9GAMM|nr:cytochrome b [Pseudomarimonas arenosa]MBD8525001.1 cytochrome b [Pseudomarimonas arenosa]